MSKDKTNNAAGGATGGGPLDVSEPFKHPAATHDQDEVVVEVVFPQGVKENGNVHRKGDKLVLKRGHAVAQNKPGRPVYRIVRTIQYVNDPSAVSTATDYEDVVEDGPLEIS